MWFRNLAIMDQYEVAIPLERVGDCMETLVYAMRDPDRALHRGFPAPSMVRFVAGDTNYLSQTHGMCNLMGLGF